MLMLCSFTPEESRIASDAGVEELSHPLLSEQEQSGETPILLWDKLATLFRTGAKSAFGEAVRSFCGIAALLVVCSLMHALKSLSGSETLSGACSFLSALALSGVTFSVMRTLFFQTEKALCAFTEYFACLLPVSGALLVSGGTPQAGAVSGAMLSLYLSFVSLICTSVLMPFLHLSFSLSFASALPGTLDLSPIGGLFRNATTLLLTLCFSLLGFLLSMQTTIASASDSLLFRTVRFASGAFIPVVGSALGDAARTVAGSVAAVKGTVGSIGTVVTFALLLPPFLSVLMHRILLSLSGALAKLLGCDAEGKFLNELGSTLSVLLGLVAGVEAIALLYLSVFIKVGAML